VIGVVAMAVFGTLRSSAIGADRLSAQSGTATVLIALGLVALGELMRPLRPLRVWLLVVLVGLAVGAFTIPFVADFFALEIPSAKEVVPILVGCLGGSALVVLAARWVGD
jgi:cation-transporting ATPase E